MLIEQQVLMVFCFVCVK